MPQEDFELPSGMALEDVASTRQEALNQGLKAYHGPDCKRGHGAVRYVSSKGCVKCARERYKRKKKENDPKPTKKAQRGPTDGQLKALEDIDLPDDISPAEVGTSKAHAQANGLSYYVGSPCRRAEHRLRYLSGACLPCKRQHYKETKDLPRPERSGPFTLPLTEEEIDVISACFTYALRTVWRRRMRLPYQGHRSEELEALRAFEEAA